MAMTLRKEIPIDECVVALAANSRCALYFNGNEVEFVPAGRWVPPSYRPIQITHNLKTVN